MVHDHGHCDPPVEKVHEHVKLIQAPGTRIGFKIHDSKWKFHGKNLLTQNGDFVVRFACIAVQLYLKGDSIMFQIEQIKQTVL